MSFGVAHYDLRVKKENDKRGHCFIATLSFRKIIVGFNNATTISIERYDPNEQIVPMDMRL